jgi:hypothetical protein
LTDKPEVNCRKQPLSLFDLDRMLVLVGLGFFTAIFSTSML